MAKTGCTPEELVKTSNGKYLIVQSRYRCGHDSRFLFDTTETTVEMLVEAMNEMYTEVCPQCVDFVLENYSECNEI